MLFSRLYFAPIVIILCAQSICRGDMAEELTRRYNDDKMSCIDQYKRQHAAYSCSGIILRGVTSSQCVRNVPKETRYAWSLHPMNRKKSSFSFAFLRKDTPFSHFPDGYDSGFILYPHLDTPRKKNIYKVHCAFPLDGHTDERAGHGCGQSKRRDDPSGTSKHCDYQGITSLKKWKKHYEKIRKQKGYFVRRQCAFDMSKSTAVRDFKIVIEANAVIRKSKRYSFRNNELLFHDWNENNPKNLPIQAFFFLLHSHHGYAKAKMYQKDYHKLTGETIPVVGIRLPKRSNLKIQIVNDS